MSYCPLIWIFWSKISTNKTNNVHERSLRIILNDYEFPYSLLFEGAYQITSHQQCINSVMIENYKYLNGPDILNDIFTFRENMYNLRKTLVHWNTDLMLFYIVRAKSSNKFLFISVRQLPKHFSKIPTGNYILNVNSRNTRKRCEIC